MKRRPEEIVVLGSTGSIGQSLMAVLREQRERFVVTGLAAGNATDLFLSQIMEFNPREVSVRTRAAAARALKLCGKNNNEQGLKVTYGADGLERTVAPPGVRKVFNAISGAAGIRPSLAAVNSGKTLLMANKEALVAAGEIIIASAKANNAEVIPVDSEHSAIFQCIRGENKNT